MKKKNHQATSLFRMASIRLPMSLWLSLVLLLLPNHPYPPTTIAEACSLLECPPGQEWVATAPLDTTVNITIAANATCTNADDFGAASALSTLACQGCSSCLSNYVYSWPDAHQYTCATTRMRPDEERISCDRLVFGNITNVYNSSFTAGHCGWDDASGRDICGVADAVLAGGLSVCYRQQNDTSVAVHETTVIDGIVLRYVATTCAPVPAPALGANSSDTTTNSTATPNTTMAPTPTTTTTTNETTTLSPTALPTTNSTATPNRTMAPTPTATTNQTSFAAPTALPIIIPTTEMPTIEIVTNTTTQALAPSSMAMRQGSLHDWVGIAMLAMALIV